MENIIIYTFNNHGLWNDRLQILTCSYKALQLVHLLKKQKKRLAFYREVPIGGTLKAPVTNLIRPSDYPRMRKVRETVFFEPIDRVEVGFYK